MHSALFIALSAIIFLSPEPSLAQENKEQGAQLFRDSLRVAIEDGYVAWHTAAWLSETPLCSPDTDILKDAARILSSRAIQKGYGSVSVIDRVSNGLLRFELSHLSESILGPLLDPVRKTHSENAASILARETSVETVRTYLSMPSVSHNVPNLATAAAAGFAAIGNESALADISALVSSFKLSKAVVASASLHGHEMLWRKFLRASNSLPETAVSGLIRRCETGAALSLIQKYGITSHWTLTELLTVAAIMGRLDEVYRQLPVGGGREIARAVFEIRRNNSAAARGLLPSIPLRSRYVVLRDLANDQLERKELAGAEADARLILRNHPPGEKGSAREQGLQLIEQIAVGYALTNDRVSAQRLRPLVGTGDPQRHIDAALLISKGDLDGAFEIIREMKTDFTWAPSMLELLEAAKIRNRGFLSDAILKRLKASVLDSDSRSLVAPAEVNVLVIGLVRLGEFDTAAAFFDFHHADAATGEIRNSLCSAPDVAIALASADNRRRSGLLIGCVFGDWWLLYSAR